MVRLESVKLNFFYFYLIPRFLPFIRIPYYSFTGSKCRLYSASVSAHWDPVRASYFSSELTSFQCFSSWHQRNDRSAIADVTSHNESDKYNKQKINAIDGFTCPYDNPFSFLGHKGYGWLQLDLKGYYSLKCIKIHVRNPASYKGLEFRF